MFLNNQASTRSILANNENATASMISRRSKSIGTKKGLAAFNENAMNVKTPHNGNKNNKDASSSSSKSGQKTQQRRRRALGDISNRKAGGGGLGGGKGGVVLKQKNNATQGALKKSASSTAKPRTSQVVKFSKTPSAKISASNKARLGGGGSATKSSKPKQQRAESEYDGVFGATTRWSTANDFIDDDARNPFDIVPGDELDVCDNFREELWEKQRKKKEVKDGKEMRKSEEGFVESVRSVGEANKKEVQDLCNSFGRVSGGGDDDDDDEWDMLNQKLPWEEEDGTFDPAEERRLSGTDPYSMWGDI